MALLTALLSLRFTRCIMASPPPSALLSSLPACVVSAIQCNADTAGSRWLLKLPPRHILEDVRNPQVHIGHEDGNVRPERSKSLRCAIQHIANKLRTILLLRALHKGTKCCRRYISSQWHGQTFSSLLMTLLCYSFLDDKAAQPQDQTVCSATT